MFAAKARCFALSQRHADAVSIWQTAEIWKTRTSSYRIGMVGNRSQKNLQNFFRFLITSNLVAYV